MHLPPIQQQASSSRFGREPVRAGVGRRYALEGDARPGDVLALAGGALVRDVNENGLVDGRDAPIGLDDLVDGRDPARVDELVGFESGPARLGRLVDVRG
jgi:hypothetical protein